MGENGSEILKKNWVEYGYCIGFITDKGLMLDLDNLLLYKVKRLAARLCNLHKLEGYIIIKSSDKNYHVVFNRYLRWKTILQIVFSQYVCIRWGIHQARRGNLTLRISKKNGKNKPKIIFCTGKEDKLIKDYLEIYNQFEEY